MGLNNTSSRSDVMAEDRLKTKLASMEADGEATAVSVADSGSVNNGHLVLDADCEGGDEEESSAFGICTQEYDLRVLSPTTRCSDGQEYTSYCVSLQTQSTAFRLHRSRTWRRFSEFVWLRGVLDKVDNWKRPPVLPSKRFWNVLDPKLVETRRAQLQQWIHQVLSEPLYLSSTALHLFLQTEMSLTDIQKYLDGCIADERMEEIWANQGKLYNYQPYNLLHNSFRQEPMEIHHSIEVHAEYHQQDNSTLPSPQALPSPQTDS